MPSTFPIITTIDDVLPFIDGTTEFITVDKGWYTYIDYVIRKDETFAEHAGIRKECRGIKFYNDGRILARPFQKFFNVGEKYETSLGAIGRVVPKSVQLKMDGSMVHGVVSPDGEVVLMTRKGRTDTALRAEAALTDKHREVITKCFLEGFTPLFEYTAPDNRIVIAYNEPRLTLLAVRHTVTGVYRKLDDYVGVIPVVDNVKPIPAHRETDIESWAKQVKEWGGEEGIVATLPDGLMVKVKADSYVVKHRAKDSLSRDRDVVTLILKGEEDDLIPLLDERSTEALKRYAKDVRDELSKTIQKLADFVAKAKANGATAKEFATEYALKELNGSEQPPAFKIFRGANANEAVMDYLKANTDKRKGLESILPLIGNKEWSNYYSFWGDQDES